LVTTLAVFRRLGRDPASRFGSPSCSPNNAPAFKPSPRRKQLRRSLRSSPSFAEQRSEREGFEPSRRGIPRPRRLAISPLQPLGYLSIFLGRASIKKLNPRVCPGGYWPPARSRTVGPRPLGYLSICLGGAYPPSGVIPSTFDFNNFCGGTLEKREKGDGMLPENRVSVNPASKTQLSA
jgi:hypothetical protein